ncbi:MAG TPA: response regulator [Planctomycetota bacterium]|nr:response regulator [Planctomycetota bacterium]
MGSSSIRILYVEDEEDDVLFMKRALSKVCPDIELKVARDGDEAVRVLSQERPPPDYVLLDLKMPRRSGLEVLQWIRGHPELKDLAVTVFSSSPEQSDLSRVHQLGVDQYIVKPVSFAELVKVVRFLCERWGVTDRPAS